MNRLLFLSLLLLLSTGVVAQRNKKPEESAEESGKSGKSAKGDSQDMQGSDKKHLDILMYYMDGDYEKGLKKAMKVTEDEETSKDALPYLYASMSLYEISFLEDYRDAYPDALKESLKWAAKYRKKDEKSSAKQGLPYLEFWEENKTFFDKLRKTAKDTAQKQLDEGKPSKGEQFYKMILAFDPGDYSTNYMMYTLRVEENDTLNGNKFLRALDAEIAKLEGLDGEPEDRIKLLKYAHIEYAKFLINANRKDEAKNVIEHLTKYVAKDEEIQGFIEEKKLQ